MLYISPNSWWRHPNKNLHLNNSVTFVTCKIIYDIVIRDIRNPNPHWRSLSLDSIITQFVLSNKHYIYRSVSVGPRPYRQNKVLQESTGPGKIENKTDLTFIRESGFEVPPPIPRTVLQVARSVVLLPFQLLVVFHVQSIGNLFYEPLKVFCEGEHRVTGLEPVLGCGSVSFRPFVRKQTHWTHGTSFGPDQNILSSLPVYHRRWLPEKVQKVLSTSLDGRMDSGTPT